MTAPHSRSSELASDPPRLLYENEVKQDSVRIAPTSTLYRDRAANERTFLAWIRTAIAIMAFGFVLEKFDLYLGYFDSLARAPATLPAGSIWPSPGLALMVFGIALAISALGRLRLVDRCLRQHDSHFRMTGMLELLLTTGVVAVGLFLVIQIGHATHAAAGMGAPAATANLAQF
jgi:putative membrane protein